MRVKIFIDFWNFQLSWNEHHRNRGAAGIVRIPWKPALYEVLVRHVDPAAQYAGTHVYASYDPNNPGNHKLRGFFNVMDGFPGYYVMVKEREPRSPMRCPNHGCHKEIGLCPHCNQEIRRTVEKGVDTALVTDLVRFGIDGYYDHAVLIAADADHVPAVRFLGQRLHRVTHAWFRGHASELRNACWDHLFFDDLMPELLPSS